ncbi:MAG: nitroreductase family protein [Dysgonomonas sp.]
MELKKVTNQGNAVMEQRRSIRKYDTSLKISREELSNILKDAMTAPSSFNLQPWRFTVIDSPEGKKMIEPYMLFNHLQWETSSAIIAIFGDMENFSYTDAILSANVENGLMSPEHKDKMLNVITTYKSEFDEERTRNSMLLDCGFVAMQLMLAAKAYGYDTNPIGGYKKKEMTEALGYDPKRYFPVLLISIGKANEDGADSIRFAVDEVTQWR